MNDRLRDLGDKAVAELRAHGGFVALADFLEASLQGVPDEVIAEPPPVAAEPEPA